MPTLHIIDALGVLFRSYHAIPPMQSVNGSSTQALFGFVKHLRSWLKTHQPTHCAVVFDGLDNKEHRRKIDPDYKRNRKPTPQELIDQILLAQEYCAIHPLPFFAIPKVEADDVIATLAQEGEHREWDVEIWSEDKDLLQLVSERVTLVRGKKRYAPQTLQEELGIFPHQVVDYLSLVGDASDNIPGCRGVGPKTASGWLKKWGSGETILQNQETLGKKGEDLNIFWDRFEKNRLLVHLLNEVDLQLGNESFEGRCSLPLEDWGKQDHFFTTMSFGSLLHQSPQCHEVDIEELPPEEIEKLPSKTSVLILEGEQVNPLCRESYAISPSLGSICFFPKKQPLPQQLRYIGHHLQELPVEDAAFDTLIAASAIYDLTEISLQQLLERLFGKTWRRQEVTYWLWKARDLLQKVSEEKGIFPFLEKIEFPLISILRRMGERGLFVDRGVLQDLEVTFADRCDECKQKIDSISGVSCNLNSPKQVAHVLFEVLEIPTQKKTKTGFSTSTEVLEDIDHPAVEALLQYRACEKLRSTYVQGLLQLIDPQTSLVHPQWIQTGTVTGRLSCRKPNMQNMPVRTKEGQWIRQAFLPTQGCFLSADYSQIELRVAAHLSQDRALIDAFEQGQDIHALTASRMNHIPLDQVTHEQRRNAKTINFGLLYGQTVVGLARQLKVDISKAKEFMDTYFKAYPQLTQYIKEIQDKAEEGGVVRTISGRERSTLRLKRDFVRRIAVNTPVQGLAADIIKRAMVSTEETLAQTGIHALLLAQIHDELLWDVRAEDVEQASIVVRECMEKAGKEVISFSLPLTVQIRIGKNWSLC